jgi:hypothetical protein
VLEIPAQMIRYGVTKTTQSGRELEVFETVRPRS